MAYARAAVQIIVDAAHADGMITVDGVGRDWDAIEPRDRLDIGQLTPDLGGQYGWWYEGLFERIPPLNAIAPIMTWTFADMVLANWTQTHGSGYWRESWTSGAIRVKLLEYFDGRAGRYAANAYGHLTSVGAWTPNLAMHIWRMPQAPDETEPGTVELWFRGATAGDVYCLGWPTEGDAGAYGTAQGRTGWQAQPYLLGKRTGDTVWTLIDTLRSTCGPRGSRGKDQPTLQQVRLAYQDGTLLVYGDDRDDPWAFSGSWKHSTGEVAFALADTGALDLLVMGHTALFGVWPTVAPASVTLYPAAYLIRRTSAMPPEQSNAPYYRLIADAPAGTGISAAIDVDGGDANAKRPALTFTSTGAKRAALFAVQEYRLATIGLADSDPVNLTGWPSFRALGVRGHVDKRYQGASCEIEYGCLPGETLNEIRPNAKVIVSSGASGGGWYKHFTGYALPPHKQRAAALNRGSVICEDMATARLARKQLGWHCSYAGWPIPDWFECILNRAGVDSSLIDISADISVALMGALYYLPLGNYRGARKLSYSPDTTVPSALDQGCVLRDLQWGVGRDGVVTLIPRVVHVAGVHDAHVEDTDLTNIIHDFRHSRTNQEFRNLLQVMIGEGVDAAAYVMCDVASWSTTANARFIGDLWCKYVALRDGDDLTSICNRLWDELVFANSLISWREMDRPDLWPNNEVMVEVDAGMNIVAGSIYRITDKRWSWSEDGRYRQDLEGELVEVGP
jgi:hypothetical protein